MVSKVKKRLIQNNGSKCMICGKYVGRMIELHHIVPKYYFKRNELTIDNSYANSSLLCPNCHIKVHKYEFGTKKYDKLMSIIKQHKR